MNAEIKRMDTIEKEDNNVIEIDGDLIEQDTDLETVVSPRTIESTKPHSSHQRSP